MDYRVEQYILHFDTDDVDVEKLTEAFKLLIEGAKWSLVSPITVENDFNIDANQHEIYLHALYIRYPNLVGLTVKNTTTTVFIDEETTNA